MLFSEKYDDTHIFLSASIVNRLIDTYLVSRLVSMPMQKAKNIWRREATWPSISFLMRSNSLYCFDVKVKWRMMKWSDQHQSITSSTPSIFVLVVHNTSSSESRRDDSFMSNKSSRQVSEDDVWCIMVVPLRFYRFHVVLSGMISLIQNTNFWNPAWWLLVV